jgi:hypothetical protein
MRTKHSSRVEPENQYLTGGWRLLNNDHFSWIQKRLASSHGGVLRRHIVDFCRQVQETSTQVVSTRSNAVLDSCTVASSMIVKNQEMNLSQKGWHKFWMMREKHHVNFSHFLFTMWRYQDCCLTSRLSYPKYMAVHHCSFGRSFSLSSIFSAGLICSSPSGSWLWKLMLIALY